MSRAEDQLHKCPTVRLVQLWEAKEWKEGSAVESVNRYHAKLEARLDALQNTHPDDSLYLMLDLESEIFIYKTLGLQRTPPS